MYISVLYIKKKKSKFFVCLFWLFKNNFYSHGGTIAPLRIHNLEKMWKQRP